MRTSIQSIHFTTPVALEEFINSRLKKLEKYYGRGFDRLVKVVLKQERDSHNKDRVVEIYLHVFGHDLFVKSKSDNFEQATDNAVEAMRRKLRKFKGKFVLPVTETYELTPEE